MKPYLVAACTLLSANHAMAAPVTLPELERLAREVAAIIKDSGQDEKGGACFATVSRVRHGVFMTLKGESEGYVTHQISDRAEIELEVEGDSSSYANTYTIQGVGTVVIVHAEDAYDTMSMTDIEGNKVTCGAYY